ncbi:MAG: YbaB/EbfC family nucleoid-associated protein [Alphaproteobacteria bacterium]|nr:YbaB/EbfC family nucleoid-associated protein [Alphaproteobacteria bacterium]MDP1975538.1 YbaB/EbfC family nucleoid-associated protein [Alphaproteobacteria bacterium]
MFKDMNKMMQQAQKLQEKMAEMQAKMQDIESEGSAGGGLVKCTLNGKGEAKSVTIDPSLLKEDEKEVLEDLIVAAMNDAKIKVDQKSQDEMQKVTGGLNLPFNI